MSTLRVANWLIVLSIIAIAGITVIDFFVPKPKLPTRAAQISSDTRARKQTQELKEQYVLHEAVVKQHRWQGDFEAVSAEVLAAVGAKAKAANIALKAFRPQRPIIEGKLTRLPYVATCEGPYTSVLQMLNGFERESAKLAVSLVQISSADAGSDSVVATIGIMAIQESLTVAPKDLKVASIKGAAKQ